MIFINISPFLGMLHSVEPGGHLGNKSMAGPWESPKPKHGPEQAEEGNFGEGRVEDAFVQGARQGC